MNSMNGHFERGGPAFPAFEVMLVIKLIPRMINRGRGGMNRCKIVRVLFLSFQTRV